MRFIVEFWRGNPIVGAGLAEYQWMSLTLIIVGAGLLYYQWKTGARIIDGTALAEMSIDDIS